MMKCFLCKDNFSVVSTFITHLKLFHLVNDETKFQCIEPECMQMFSNLARFKKHIDKHTKLVVAEDQNLLPNINAETIFPFNTILADDISSPKDDVNGSHA